MPINVRIFPQRSQTGPPLIPGARSWFIVNFEKIAGAAPAELMRSKAYHGVDP